MKRVLIMSDLHCGHLVGLTPPAWQIRTGSEHNTTKREKFAVVQSTTWDWYAAAIREAGPFDVVVVNGDAIDGKGERSGSSELITADRDEQCEIAVAAIKTALSKRTKHVVMTYGTAYHTGVGEDFETRIAEKLDAKIGSHEWIDVEGVVFDLKHHILSSSLPHGRFTAIARDALWANLWSERDMAPQSNVLVRSHVHYFATCYDNTLKPAMRLTTPALQAAGTKYGGRRCSGTVDFGFLVFDCNDSDYAWKPYLAQLETLKAEVMKC